MPVGTHLADFPIHKPSLDAEFEETSKLRLKYTKSVLKARADKFNEVLTAVSKLDEKFGSAIKSVVENSSRIDPKVVSNELREVEKKLEASEKSGKEAEKLLREAKLQGTERIVLSKCSLNTYIQERSRRRRI